MSLPEEEYTTKKARSLSEMKKLGLHSYSSCSKHLGCVKSPLTHMGQQTNHIRQLEEAVHSCGVSFQIWQCREPSGKPIPGSFEFTALRGKDKLKVFKKLPAKMDSPLSEDLAPQVARLWNVCYTLLCIMRKSHTCTCALLFQDFSCLHSTMSSASPFKTEIDSFHEKVLTSHMNDYYVYTCTCMSDQKAKQWVNDFLALGKHIEGHQRKNVTPYLYHGCNILANQIAV